MLATTPISRSNCVTIGRACLEYFAGAHGCDVVALVPVALGVVGDEAAVVLVVRPRVVLDVEEGHVLRVFGDDPSASGRICLHFSLKVASCSMTTMGRFSDALLHEELVVAQETPDRPGCRHRTSRWRRCFRSWCACVPGAHADPCRCPAFRRRWPL